MKLLEAPGQNLLFLRLPTAPWGYAAVFSGFVNSTLKISTQAVN